jgi:hypothetical protein
VPAQREAFGCTCGRYLSVRDAYLSSDLVFVGTVIKSERIKGDRKVPVQTSYGAASTTVVSPSEIVKTYIRIEKIYKCPALN